jgi:hypothetical protein
VRECLLLSPAKVMVAWFSLPVCENTVSAQYKYAMKKKAILMDKIF